MLSRKSCCLVSAAVFSSLIAFSGMSIHADAAQLTTELTPAQTLQLYGTSITAYYMANLNDYRETRFDYVTTVQGCFDSSSVTDNDFLVSYTVANTYNYLVYACADVPYYPTASSGDFQFELLPDSELSNVTFFRSSLLYYIHSSGSNGQLSSYPSTVDLSVDGDSVEFGNLKHYNSFSYRGTISSDIGSFPFPSDSITNSTKLNFAAISYTLNDEDAFTVSYNKVDLFGMTSMPCDDSDWDGMYVVLIQCPIISDGFTITGGGGSGSGDSGSDITVNVEMSETNSLLGSLLQSFNGFVSGILDGIKNLFIPDDEALEDFQSDMQDALSEHLGGLYEAIEVISDSFSDLGDVTARSSITVPQTVIPLLGADFTVGPWVIPLKVDDRRLDFVYDAIAFIIDFLFTAAFVNMLRRKLEIFLNPETEVITDDS